MRVTVDNDAIRNTLILLGLKGVILPNATYKYRSTLNNFMEKILNDMLMSDLTISVQHLSLLLNFISSIVFSFEILNS